jgi:hypothetical protein
MQAGFDNPATGYIEASAKELNDKQLEEAYKNISEEEKEALRKEITDRAKYLQDKAKSTIALIEGGKEISTLTDNEGYTTSEMEEVASFVNEAKANEAGFKDYNLGDNKSIMRVRAKPSSDLTPAPIAEKLAIRRPINFRSEERKEQDR